MVETDLLRADPGTTTLVYHRERDTAQEATAEAETGILRNEDGESFSVGAYQQLEDDE